MRIANEWPSIASITNGNRRRAADLSFRKGLRLLTTSRPYDETTANEFRTVDLDIETAYRCPRCTFEWSGRPKPPIASDEEPLSKDRGRPKGRRGQAPRQLSAPAGQPTRGEWPPSRA
jgi:hypothetical protein